MGFLTNVSISNDFWHTIAKNPQALVDYIGRAMNDGTRSPLREALDEKYDRPHRKEYGHELRYSGPQGVLVHHARHYDEAQVIVNPYGSYPVNAAELPGAINNGWLDLNKYNEDKAEATARILEDTAKQIRQALKKANA